MSIIEQGRQILGRGPVGPAILGAVAVNLIPVLGVLFWGWNAAALMVLYWLENVVIGVFNVARMAACGAAHGRVGIVSSLFLIPFFAVHYGMFCLVHGVFVFTFFGGGLAHLQTLSTLDGPGDLGRLIGAVLALQPGLKTGLWAIIVWQGVQFGVFFLAAGAYRKIDPASQMFAPYGRIVVLHITIMAAGALVLALGAPMLGVLMLALLKTGFDVRNEARDDRAPGAKAWGAVQALAAHGFSPAALSPPPQQQSRAEDPEGPDR